MTVTGESNENWVLKLVNELRKLSIFDKKISKIKLRLSLC